MKLIGQHKMLGSAINAMVNDRVTEQIKARHHHHYPLRRLRIYSGEN